MFAATSTTPRCTFALNWFSHPMAIPLEGTAPMRRSPAAASGWEPSMVQAIRAARSGESTKFTPSVSASTRPTPPMFLKPSSRRKFTITG